MTITDVALALGVSKASVSRAITGKGRISPRTKARILEYMEEHNFRPNVIAQSLANLKTYNLAFTIPNQQEFSELPFFQQTLVGACDFASKCNYDVIVVNVNDDDISHMCRVVDYRKVDGVILSRNVDNDAMIDYLQNQGIPFVLIGTTENDSVVQVDSDHLAACNEMTSIILKSVSGNVGLIGGNHRHVVNRHRFEGFDEALDGRGGGAAAWDCTDDASIINAFESFYNDGIRTIFCMDDMICTHLLQHLHRKGIAHDVRLVSYYSSRYLETHMPPVPSISFDVKEQGETACKLLLKMLEGTEVPHRTLMGYKLLNCGLNPDTMLG